MINKTIKDDLINLYHLAPLSTWFAIIQGDKAKTLNSFMTEVKIAFHFPNYYAGNMNSFTEIMNDLSWLNSDDFILIISESEKFLQNESFGERESIKRILNEISEEWKNVPNYLGEDEYRKKSNFIIHYM